MSDTLWRNGQGCCEEVRGRLGRLRIPFGKVHANMKSKEDQMGDVRADVFGFVMLSGSLSPIHTMHMALMDVARNVVQTVFNIPVPVGFLIPCSDVCVRQKLGSGGLSLPERVEVAQLASRSSPWGELFYQVCTFVPLCLEA
eukprot:GHVS01042486.1.p1 GENE.GHVS01042486.1~~GHVS01042486.1.p1  ORF type:complete len:142 (-),score=20.15 GHVS01042486.1:67-492(-)